MFPSKEGRGRVSLVPETANAVGSGFRWRAKGGRSGRIPVAMRRGPHWLPARGASHRLAGLIIWYGRPAPSRDYHRLPTSLLPLPSLLPYLFPPLLNLPSFSSALSYRRLLPLRAPYLYRNTDLLLYPLVTLATRYAYPSRACLLPFRSTK